MSTFTKHSTRYLIRETNKLFVKCSLENCKTHRYVPNNNDRPESESEDFERCLIICHWFIIVCNHKPDLLKLF